MNSIAAPLYWYSFLKRDFWIFFFFMYDIQHCFICRPSDSTVSEDAGIEPRTVAITALAVRRLDLIHHGCEMCIGICSIHLKHGITTK